MIFKARISILVILFWLGPIAAIYAQDIGYEEISRELLHALKDKAPTDKYEKILAESTVSTLADALKTDKEKLAFWINIYNAYIQLILNEHPEYYDDRRSFFSKPLIDIAGRKMSFAAIEHGIIRHSQFQLFLGYLTNPFPPDYEKVLRVAQKDWRIHFALNCGAKSCPPVAIYHPQHLDQQLDFMTTAYLNDVSRYDPEEDRVYSTILFSWFRGDFGGPKGIRQILQKHGVVHHTPKNVRVTAYDWTLDLDNWRAIRF
jgi:hypothetical protein